MGGTNSIVEWAKMNPSLANRDYVHPNHRGAAVLARYLFEAIMTEYNKYTRTLPTGKSTGKNQ
jgi:lysophospholipase L1-like esterase